MLNSLIGAVAGVLMLVGGFLGIHTQQPVQTPSFGAFSPSGGGTYRIGQSIGTSDTTVKLSSFKEPVSGISYTMSYLGSDIEYGTISPQSSISEFVSFSGITQNTDGSATLTGVIRGLTRTPAGNFCTASTTLAQSHAGQSIFILSNSPCFQAEYLPARTNATSTAIIAFSSTTPPRYDSVAAQSTGTYISTTSELASIAYVNAISVAGVSNGTASVKGIYQSATGAQASSGTLLGGTGASLALTSSISTSTCQVAQNSVLTASSTTGKLDAGCIATNGALIYTGNNRFTASTTFTGPVDIGATSTSKVSFGGLPYTYPTTRAASSTVQTENGSGALGWYVPNDRLLALSSPNLNSTAGATTSIATVVIPANTIINSSQTLRIKGTWQTWGSNACGAQVDFGTGSATTTVGISGMEATNLLTSVINVDMFATSTASQMFTSQSYSSTASGASDFAVSGSTKLIIGRIETARSFAAATYLSFATNGANCTLLSYAVELLSL